VTTPVRRMLWPLATATMVATAIASASPSSWSTEPPATVVRPATSGVGSEVAAPPVSLGMEFGPGTSLEQVRAHLAVGDTRRALAAANAVVAHNRWGRERAAAQLVVGLLHRSAERHNLASEAFTQVRAGGTALAPWGAFYEAEQDLARGKEWVAIRECERYRETWPAGEHANTCLSLIARAHARLGNMSAARTAAGAYDAEHKIGGMGEQIELALAMRLTRTHPEQAVRPLRDLSAVHSAPLTGRVAEELLQELAANEVPGAGDEVDVSALMQRAVSLRDAKRYDEAWRLFQELQSRSDDSPSLRAWVQGSAERFGWRCHKWDFLHEMYSAAYAERPDGDLAWNAYRVAARGGRFADAIEWAKIGRTKHGKTRSWSRKEEDLGRTFMLGGAYEEARDLFDTVARRGGWTGRRGKFFAGLSAHLAGDHDGALERLDSLVALDRTYATEARYWRSRVYEAVERHPDAMADRRILVEEDPWGWYGMLALQGFVPRHDDPTYARDGTWAGANLPIPEEYVEAWEIPSRPTHALPIARPTSVDRSDPTGAVSSLSWSLLDTRVGPLQPVAPPPAPVMSRIDPTVPPQGYAPGVFFDPDKARGLAGRLVGALGESWPEAAAIRDLAAAGLYDLSGPAFSRLYEEWRDAYRYSGNRRHVSARKLTMRSEEWRQLFYLTRDHHHTARFTHDLWEQVDDPSVALQARRLGYPLAHDTVVWRAARQHGVDPFLVMGLMRQESTYNAIAVSPVGARGAMQIMPRTGHLMADLRHDVTFTAGALEDPVLSVEYGIDYLGLLMQRFDGAYPLAIASYNGGPFNVSAWLTGTGSEMPMDAWVEHIPFRETRQYVKKVSAGYAAYVGLYAPPGASIALPSTPGGDHPEVVDF
jgi:soluble lytic murein transglycosylase-like protein